MIHKPPIAPPPLNYAQATPGWPRPRRFSVAVLVTTAVPAWLLAAAMLFVVPEFEEMFRNFKLELPQSTQLVLSLSHIIAKEWGWVPLVLFPFGLAIAFPVLPLRGRWIRLIIVLTTMLIVLLMVMALMSPMIALIDGLSSGK